MMTVVTEMSKALDCAVENLKRAHQDPQVLITAARKVTSLADDAELIAWESSDRESRTKLLQEVQDARTAADSARQIARNHSLKTTRESLLENNRPNGITNDNTSSLNGEVPNNRFSLTSHNRAFPPGDEPISETARLARDINDTLRRTTAVVAEEVARSRAAGDVVEDSSRRLARTRDQHVGLGKSLRQGSKTLRRLRSSETLANAVVIISFGIFFITAGYVISRRLRSSLVISAVVRPATSVVFYPFALVYRGGVRLSKVKYSTRLSPQKNTTVNTTQFSPSYSSNEHSKGEANVQSRIQGGSNVGSPNKSKLTMTATISTAPSPSPGDENNETAAQVYTVSPKLNNEVSTSQIESEVYHQHAMQEAGTMEERADAQELRKFSTDSSSINAIKNRPKTRQNNGRTSEFDNAEEL